MGWVSTNSGQRIHTSSLSNTTTTATGSIYISNGTLSSGTTISPNSYGTTYTISPPTVTYIILGEELEIEGYSDAHICNIIASINVLGKSYYDELMKQPIILPTEIEEFLEKKFIILERDRKIDEVIKNKK